MRLASCEPDLILGVADGSPSRCSHPLFSVTDPIPLEAPTFSFFKLSHYSIQNRPRNPSLLLCCSLSAFNSATLPLPLILFPVAVLPLRITMHTLLYTDLRFVVVFSDGGGAVAEVGCVGEVVKHEHLVDGCFFLIGPYPTARGPAHIRPTDAGDLETYMQDVIRISNCVNGKTEKDGVMDQRRNLFPALFWFFVGSTFEGPQGAASSS